MNEKEVMNAQMEKYFFSWILEHPIQFEKIEPEFFKNEDIQFIYRVIRGEFLVAKDKKTPSLQQIVAMIKLQDPEEKISNNVIKAILKNDNSVHNQDWLENKFSSWRLANIARNDVYSAIDLIRNIKELDLDTVTDVATRLQSMFGNLNIINETEDLGADFDDPEMHKQETHKNKISSGWSNVDIIMHGGWDKGTFNVLMGETNVGKCFSGLTRVSVKNKYTNEIKQIKIEDFYKMLKK
jgi:hypothetical protein